jgi:diguanylate cyclase (GGDEF)-like protein
LGITKKIALLNTVLCTTFIGVMLIIVQLVWGKSFLALEQDEIKDNAARVYHAWNEELDFLSSLVGDWAPWDELYKFARNPADTEFVDKNLTDSQMANIKINLAVVTTPDGKILFAKAINLASKTEAEVPKEVLDELSEIIKNHVIEPQDEEFVKSFIVVKDQPVLFAMQRILRSDKQGPSPGVLIFAKYGNEGMLQEISKRTQVKFFFESGSALPMQIAGNGVREQVVKQGEVLDYFSLQDAYGNVRYLVSTTPRAIVQQGNAQMRFFLVLSVIFGGLFTCVTLWLLNRIILSKIRKIDSFMTSIIANNDYSKRLDLPGKDELSKAAATMNNMLTQIEVSHKKIEALYHAVRQELEVRQKAEQHLRYLSMHDQLTGLYNRAFLEQAIPEIVKNQTKGIGVICCDLDGLKLTNDTMGHYVGDNVLIETARTLDAAVGDKAVVARIGGDEFVVIMSNIEQKEIYRACEKIKEIIIKDPDGRGTQLRLSCGWAYVEGPDITQTAITNIIKQADDMMYRQKLSSSQSKRSGLVQGMLEMLKVRDFLTEGHSQRMQENVKLLGENVGLNEDQLADLLLLAQFHDVGKVGIPDNILFKPGPLTPEERKEMERHSEIGHRIAQSVPELLPIGDLILKHHEWWNGEGYPLGIKGGEIPLGDRILAIVDAFDAMTNDRSYRKALSDEKAIAELRRYAGVQFDPNLVERFITLIRKHDTGVVMAAAIGK